MVARQGLNCSEITVNRFTFVSVNILKQGISTQMGGGGGICMGSNEKLLAKTFTSDDDGFFRKVS